MRPAILSAALAVLLVPAGAAASDAVRPPARHEITLLGGAHRFREGDRLTDSVILRGSVGRYLTGRHEVLGHATVVLTSDSVQPFPGEGGAARVEAVLYGLDYVLYPWPLRAGDRRRRFLPYLSAGLGGVSVVAESAHADARLLVNAGAGVKYVLSDRFAFNAGVRVFSTALHRSILGEPGYRLRIDSFMTGLSMRI